MYHKRRGEVGRGITSKRKRSFRGRDKRSACAVQQKTEHTILVRPTIEYDCAIFEAIF